MAFRERGLEGQRDANSAEAALAAATAGGVWRQAPFDGGGIPDGTQRDFETQFRAPHTGIVYTPPAFSDHIAVSLLLAATVARPRPAAGADAVLVLDRQTKLAMHKQQRTLAETFAARTQPMPKAAAASAARAAAPSGGAVAAASSGTGITGSGASGISGSRSSNHEDAGLKRALELSKQDASGRANARAGGGGGGSNQVAAKKQKKGHKGPGIANFFAPKKYHE